MNKPLKKMLGVLLSVSMAAGTVVLPAATASADTLKSWKFDFGATAVEGWTQVTASDAYTDEKGYGFLGQDNVVYDGVVDGYNQSVDNQTELKNGGTGTDAYHDYVYTEEDHMPIRFAVKTDNNTYYRIKVTMGYSDKDSEIYLTSERRHFVLTDEKITAGGKIEKTFTAAVHSVKWKNRNAGSEPVYADNMINVCVHGKNAMINAIEIQQVEKPKVVWIFGDSTTTDSSSGAPWFGYNTYTGWGAGVAKYLPEDVAVVNLGEGGLAIDSTAYFDVGKNDMTAGDILMMAMGHNGTTPTADNIKPYYDAITSKGGTFVSCSPIERIENASTAAHNDTFKNFATANNCPFVSLYDISKKVYETTLNGNPGYWYSHTIFWKGSASNPQPERDGSHLNDFGVEWIAKGAFEALAAQAETYTALAPYVTAQASVSPVAFSRDMMTAKGTDDYKNDTTIIKPPHAGFPYPDPAIDYRNTVDITSANVKTEGGKTYLTDYKTVRHSDLSYITAWAAAYDANGVLTGIRMNRLEPMTAKTVETVYLTKKTVNGATTEETVEPLEIPEGGSYKTFVWEGAFADNSLTYKSYSDVFSGYDTTPAASEWTVTPAATPAADDAVNIPAGGKGVAKLATPVTSGKVMFDFDLTPGGDGTIVLSPAADGSEAAGAMKFSLNSTTGVLSRSVVGSDGKTATVEVIDGLKSGDTQNLKFIYDIDYAELQINGDGVGIAYIDYPEALDAKALVPDKIASIAINGAAKVENYSASTVAVEPLPEKTLTITYDADKGSVTETGSDTAITSKTAAKNANIKLTAVASPTPEHNYVFGGWRNPDNSVFSKDASISIYLVDDMTLTAFFYEQGGVETVSDYTITAKTGANDATITKLPAAGSTDIALDITDIVDSSGNPPADFAHTAPNVTWALKNNIAGVSIDGSTLTVNSSMVIPKEEMVTLTVTATCNSVSKDYDIIVHNFTDLMYHEDYEAGAGAAASTVVPKWVSALPGRYQPYYATANGNTYLDLVEVDTSTSNNGTTVTGTLLDSQIDGVAEVVMDFSLKRPSGTDASRQAVIGLRDKDGKYAVAIAKSQTPANFKVNGKAIGETFPGDTDWARLTTVMNYVTKTADIKITSLDGAAVYYNEKNVAFDNKDASGFIGITFESNRNHAAATIDNIFVDKIAVKDNIPAITTTTNPLEITNLTQPTTVNLTVPDGYTLASAVSSDTEVATVAFDAAAETVTITPVKSGDITVTVVAANDENAYIKSLLDLTVAMKKNDNADLKALSVKKGDVEYIDSFAGGTLTYNVKAQKDVTALTVSPTTDHTGATYTVNYNGAAVSGGTVTLTGSAANHVITVVVTAPDTTTTKTYTINVDNTYDLAENFSANTGAWGFSGEGFDSAGTTVYDSSNGGYLRLLDNSKAWNGEKGEKPQEAKKTFDTDISSATKLNITFDWQSQVQASQGRHSNFVLRDGSDNVLFLLRGQGKTGLYYALSGASNAGDAACTKFADFSQNWYTIDLTIDFTTHKLSGTITPKAGGAAVKTFTNETITADNLSNIYTINTYGLAKMGLDNVYIKVME